MRLSIWALCQALPLCARAAWDVLRDSLGMEMSESKVRPTGSGILLDALPQHINKKIFQVLIPAVPREYMEVSATEAARYIYYRKLRASLGKPDMWDALTSAEKLEFVPQNPTHILRAQTEATLSLSLSLARSLSLSLSLSLCLSCFLSPGLWRRGISPSFYFPLSLSLSLLPFLTGLHRPKDTRTVRQTISGKVHSST